MFRATSRINPPCISEDYWGVQVDKNLRFSTRHRGIAYATLFEPFSLIKAFSRFHRPRLKDGDGPSKLTNCVSHHESQGEARLTYL